PDRARQAAAQAGHSTLLDITVDGARGMLVKVSGGPDMSLPEVKDAVAAITARAHPGALVIFGAAEDERLRGELSVTVIATGFDRPDRPLLAPKQAPRRPIFGQPSSQPVLQTAR
ncbi:MAG: cell division protein FtsZ, partial [Candidatus Promineifilaceae bacterium]